MKRLLILAIALWTFDASGQYVPQWARASLPGFFAGTIDEGRIWFVNRNSSFPGQASLDRSLDGGRTWTPARGFELLPATTKVSISEVPGQPAVVYARTGKETDLDGAIFLSLDYGASWSQVSSATITGQALGRVKGAGPQPGLVFATRSLVTGSITPVATAAGLVRSLDGGRTWADIPLFAGKPDASIHPTRDPAVVFAAETGNLYRSRDRGTTWQQLSLPLSADSITEVLADAREAGLVYVQARSGALMASHDAGDAWRVVNPPSGMATMYATDPRVARRIFGSTVDGDAYESRDAGLTWRQLAIGRAPAMSSQNSGVTVHDPLIAPLVAAYEDSRAVLLAISRPASPVKFDVTDAGPVLGTGLWWDPRHSGWGVSIVQHAAGQMFVVWFTHDAAGKPTWLYMSGGKWTDANTYSGFLVKANGSSYLVPWNPNAAANTIVGSGTLHFDDAARGNVSFAMSDGTRFESRIERMLFGPVDPVAHLGWSDLWWNRSESGWGIGLHQQFGTVFATLFVFDERSEPTWFYASSMQETGFNALRILRGDMYQATAAPGAAFASNGVTSRFAGTLELSVPSLLASSSVSGADLRVGWPASTRSAFVQRVPF